MTTTRAKPKYITVVRQVVLKAMRDTLAIVCAQPLGLVEVAPHENVSKNRTCVTAKTIMDFYLGGPFYNTIANFGKEDVLLPKYQKVEN